MLEHLLDRLALLLERVEVRAEDLHRQRALQAGLGLIDRILGRLGIVEDDAGKGFELVVDRRDQRRLGVILAVPLRIGFEPDIEFGVEETRRIGAIVRPAQLGCDGSDFGEGGEHGAHLRRDLRRFIERDRIGHRRADPQSALVELRHELSADARHQQQRDRQQPRRHARRHPGTGEAGVEALAIG